MRFDVFTCHKDPSRPLANDDRVVSYGGRLFAVIDGVTDKSGRPLPDGTSRGQAAGRLIERVLCGLVDEGVSMTAGAAYVLDSLQKAFMAEYRLLGMEDEAVHDPHLRFGAQLAALFYDGEAWRVFVVGDCGVRINGTRVLGTSNRGDALVALWRAKVFAAVTDTASTTVDTALAVARRYTVEGSGRFLEEHAQALPASLYRRCVAEAQDEACAAFPDLDRTLVLDTLAQGLLGLGKHRNGHGPLASPCIDGTAVPAEQVKEEIVAGGDARSFELFSDGYFGTPAQGATAVSDWERHLAGVEAGDPYKVGPYRSTKGSSSGTFTDDRTVMVVLPNWTHPQVAASGRGAWSGAG